MKKTLLALLLVLSIAFVTPVLTTAQAKSEYSSYVNARTKSALMIEPTAVLEPESLSDLPTSAQASSSGISAVMLTPDKDLNVTFDGNKTSFIEFFNSRIKGVFIPVLRLDNTNVDGFIDMMNDTYLIKDITVVSSDLEVLKKISEDKVSSIANTVYDLTEIKIPQNRYGTWEYIAESNKYYTNTLMFDASDENFAVAAEYLSAMSKVCWAMTDTEDEALSAISCGATGVVVKKSSDFVNSVSYFKKSGFTKAQNVAAHRGITAYANQNSEMAVAASVSEGATHAEIDIQFTRDGEFIICHDMTSNNFSSTKGVSFEPTLSSYATTLKLNDYSAKYGDCFPLLDEIIQSVRKSDLILIIELKLEDGRTTVVNKNAIEKFVTLMKSYPYMEGRWFTITFYKPYADQMHEFAPEIPVGFLGGATSGYEKDLGLSGWNGEWTHMSNISSKIAFMHKYRTLLDESYDNYTSTTAQNYLARGYLQNSWTFNNLSHFSAKLNIATSNSAEKCADCIKSFAPSDLVMTSEQLESGKITVNTINYNGWQQERECDVIVVSKDQNSAKVLLYYNETSEGSNYGLYSQVLTYKIN